MLSFDNMKKKHGNITTVGQQLKKSSDMVMQQTFVNDVQTKLCYLYDYYHDDQPDEEYGYDPSLSTTKIPVMAKFIVKSYVTIAKDEPDYHLQFAPNDWNNQTFKRDWFDRYDRLGIRTPTGFYVDIANDRGVYEKWLILYIEDGNQFIKLGLLKCNYRFMWIEDNGINRYKRKVWGINRSQNSYTSGIYYSDKTTVFDDQDKFILPWSPITSEIKHDMRMFVSMLQEQPTVWRITKVNNTSPKGIIYITGKQDAFNEHQDYVNLETGEMFADYYQKAVIPTEEEKEDSTTIVIPEGYINLRCTIAQLKVGGSYRSITATCFSKDDVDITESYKKFNWEYTIDDKDVSGLIDMVEIDVNKIKIKFIGDEYYLGKVLTVKCKSDTLTGELQLNIVAL